MANAASPTEFNITSRNETTYSTQTGLVSPNDILCMGDVSTKHEKILKETKSMLRIVVKDSLESLVMIDALQHLGIGYHFQEEIQEILDIQFTSSVSICSSDSDLFEVSTRFRVLRQEGYNVPTDIFNQFIDKEGKLKPQLSKDIRGLISFYEASQLSINGEEVLDQAAYSCAQFLHESIPYLDHDQAEIVTNTLQYPCHKSFAKLASKNLTHLKENSGTSTKSIRSRKVINIYYLSQASKYLNENQDGKDGSYIEYYMKENKGCTTEVAKMHVMEMISKAWKSLNKEYLRESPFSKTFKKGCLNSARMVSSMYSYDEKQRLPLLEEYMKSMKLNKLS